LGIGEGLLWKVRKGMLRSVMVRWIQVEGCEGPRGAGGTLRNATLSLHSLHSSVSEQKERKLQHLPSMTFPNCSLSSLFFRIDMAFLVVFSAKSNSM